jgi:hypothetical protein
LPHAYEVKCTGGSCGVAMCDNGFTDCNQIPDDGCECQGTCDGTRCLNGAVSCAGQTCLNPDDVCCYSALAELWFCSVLGDECLGASGLCAGEVDCGNGEVCCTSGDDSDKTTYCVFEAQCVFQVCAGDAECRGLHCCLHLNLPGVPTCGSGPCVGD